MAKPAVRRCAIYTRKSSEEGLEQEYNSLDAQRDAAEAFIRSQKHEGWKALRDTYDDGGVSGGHLERPGLQRLLHDIRAGKIDIVIVYKVDRLSRSLADFAQLMQLFDKNEVSFVSVTQQFNTSTSMGRLTLNVLLSFAQFEREVTGERIRDKIALSKQKGMWMGGIPPLGYDAVDGKLRVNPGEAEVVGACFRTYLASGGLIEAVQELNCQGLKTKSFISSKGRVQEGKPWVAKQLHRILIQPLYRGRVQHKGQSFAGEHEALIDEALWDEVQQKLRSQQPEFRKTSGHLNEIAIEKTRLLHPLKGFVSCLDGHALTPTYTNKSETLADGTKVRKRYRYYVSQQAIRQGYENSTLKTLNAERLETAVQLMLAQSLPEIAQEIEHSEFTPDQIRKRFEGHAATLTSRADLASFARVIQLLEPKIVVETGRIRIHLSIDRLGRLADWVPEVPQSPPSLTSRESPQIEVEGGAAVITANVSFARRRGEVRLVDARTGALLEVQQSSPNPVLIQVLVQAEYWRSELQRQPTKCLGEVVEPHGVSANYARRLINAAYLAPEIKQAIFQGTQPLELQVQDLIKPRSMDWEVQKRELGFHRLATSALQ